MGDFSLTTAIERPPAVVFAFIAEPTNMTRWYDAVVHVSVPPHHAVGQGVTFEITRTLPGGQAVNRVEVTEFEPARHITLESRNGPTPFRYRYSLEPTGVGTLLRLDGRITSAGLAGPAADLGPVATELFTRGMKHNLGVLKAAVESEPFGHSATENSMRLGPMHVSQRPRT